MTLQIEPWELDDIQKLIRKEINRIDDWNRENLKYADYNAVERLEALCTKIQKIKESRL